MKKQIKALTAGIACLLLALMLCVPTFAQDKLGYVTDTVSLLTGAQSSALEREAESIAQQYQCGVYIIVLDDFTAYGDAYDVETAAKSIYKEYGLGVGDEKSGLLLLLSMAERDYALVAYGYGNTAFTDYGKDKMSEEFLDNFSQNDWNGGFTDYLNKSAELLQTARDGKPFDENSDPSLGKAGWSISLALGSLVSGIVSFFMRLGMHSVAAGVEADEYIPAGSIAITRREDRFTHTTEVRTRVDRKSNATTVDSEGFSSKSGKF